MLVLVCFFSIFVGINLVDEFYSQHFLRLFFDVLEEISSQYLIFTNLFDLLVCFGKDRVERRLSALILLEDDGVPFRVLFVFLFWLSERRSAYERP